jgi:hypothetical protein
MQLFSSLLEMLLACFLGSNIFLWFLIIWLIIFLMSLACSFLYWFGYWFLIWEVLFLLSWAFFFFFACTRFGVYTVMVAGWSSTLKLWNTHAVSQQIYSGVRWDTSCYCDRHTKQSYGLPISHSCPNTTTVKTARLALPLHVFKGGGWIWSVRDTEYREGATEE